MRPEPHGALGPQCKCLMAYDRTNPLQSFSVRQNQGLMSQANHSTCLPKCCYSFAGQEDEVWTNDLCRPPPGRPQTPTATAYMPPHISKSGWEKLQTI